MKLFIPTRIIITKIREDTMEETLETTIICSEHCGSKCCQSTPPALTMDDFERISKSVKGKEWFNSIESSNKKASVISKKKNSNDCYFLADTNLCQIYENKPLDCRLFPLFIKIKEIEKDEYELKWLVWYCPLTDTKGIEVLKEEARIIIEELLVNNPEQIFEYQNAMYASNGYKKKHALDEEYLKIRRSEI